MLIRSPVKECNFHSSPTFGLDTERYFVSLLIHSECGNIRIIITPNADTFHALFTFRQKSGSFQYNASLTNTTWNSYTLKITGTIRRAFLKKLQNSLAGMS